MIDYYTPNIDLVLIGSGFTSTYHMGALYLLRQIWPNKSFERVTGSSSGGILGALAVIGTDILEILEICINSMIKFRTSFKRECKGDCQPWKSLQDMLREKLELVMPEDCHKLCTDRFGLTLTNPFTLTNIFVCKFETRADLIDSIVAGSFIPLLSGSLRFPTYKNGIFMDGGFRNLAPRFDIDDSLRLDGRKTICISALPTNDEDDLSPECSDYWFSCRVVGVHFKLNWTIIKTAIRCIFPFEPSSYMNFFEDGFNDMKNYVLMHDMIKCINCYKNQAFDSNVNLKFDQNLLVKPCLYCLKLKEMVDLLMVERINWS